MDNKEIIQESKFKKLFFNEVTAGVAIISLVVGFMNWVNNPVKLIETKLNDMITTQALIQKDINIINTNHLSHIQDLITAEDERNDKQDLTLDEIRDNIGLMNNSLVELKTLLTK
jgi:hypothetical protein